MVVTVDNKKDDDDNDMEESYWRSIATNIVKKKSCNVNDPSTLMRKAIWMSIGRELMASTEGSFVMLEAEKIAL